MGLFSYREKRYGKLALVLLALVILALAGGAIYGGIYAVMHMSHWSKYVIIVVACIIGLVLAVFGLFLFFFTFSMINSWKSGRDMYFPRTPLTVTVLPPLYPRWPLETASA